ncbi:MAG: hypothetical protein ABF443_06130 [Acetobacter malorum]|uniref:hypothetical protein n=1 Tax=Acetobacter malorum TaxID=178901 RepID=UPI0039E9EB37
MDVTLLITREPFALQDKTRPALRIMPDAVYALVVTDPSLDFEESPSDPGYGTILYKSPDSSGSPQVHRFSFTKDGIRSTNADAPLVLKLLDLAKKLKAHVLSDHGALYFKDASGLLNITEDLDAKSYITGDKGTRYAVTPAGALADPARLPDYLAENDYSFLQDKPENQQRKTNASAPALLKGLGTFKCSLFSKVYQKNVTLSIHAYYFWCLSFLSGMNFAYQDSPEKNVTYQTSNPVVNEDIAFLYAYCTRNPDDMFVSACLALRTMRLDRQ